MRNAGIAFRVKPAAIDESPRDGESPVECAQRLAREKALSVSRLHPQDCVLGADTIVVVDEKILGKPRDAADAARMLRLLSGRTHEVITGVCLVRPPASCQRPVARKSETETALPQDRFRGELKTENREPRTASEITRVTMCGISDDDIKEYIATGEPMDKAGAYAIQGIASRWIPRIEGDYSNVVGLPVALVYRMLQDQREV